LEGEQTDSWIYIREGEEATKEYIPDGSYEVFITTGSTWVPYERRFQESASYEKLENPLEFSSSGGAFATWELTLETVEGKTRQHPGQ